MQIVGYDAGDGTLLVSDGSGVDRMDLEAGTELAYTLGDRHCAGTIAEGCHVACDAGDAPFCEAHSDVWVCARCTGTCLKDEMDCHDDHAVYLAAFAPDTFKVGVTRLWRLETRLREQGADRAAHVRTVDNGRIAREIETALAGGATDAGADLVDRVRVPAKRAGLHRSVDETAWNALLEDFEVIERFDFDYGLALHDRPVAETMLTGRVRGTKGRLLVLERGGSTYGVDVRDLVGYEVVAERTERDLQSNLGAFG